MVNLQLIQSYVDPDQEVLYDVHSCFEQCEVRGIEKKKSNKNHFPVYENNGFYFIFVISLVGGHRKKKSMLIGKIWFHVIFVLILYTLNQ